MVWFHMQFLQQSYSNPNCQKNYYMYIKTVNCSITNIRVVAQVSPWSSFHIGSPVNYLPTYLPTTTKTVGLLQCVVCGDWTQQIVHSKFQLHSVCNFEGTEATVQSPYAILGAYSNNHTLYLGRYSKIVIYGGVGDLAMWSWWHSKVNLTKW